jgi:hypothetical protein|tara:strand:- start:259 stop:462 length:204 start_codon:yes stop_codon:yes gene_type:complete
MGRLKAAMMDIGEEAMTHGVEPTASKYAMSTDDVQMCIMFACAYDGTWTDFVREHPDFDPRNGVNIH